MTPFKYAEDIAVNAATKTSWTKSFQRNWRMASTVSFRSFKQSRGESDSLFEAFDLWDLVDKGVESRLLYLGDLRAGELTLFFWNRNYGPSPSWLSTFFPISAVRIQTMSTRDNVGSHGFYPKDLIVFNTKTPMLSKTPTTLWLSTRIGSPRLFEQAVNGFGTATNADNCMKLHSWEY